MPPPAALALLFATGVQAQALEPRSYSNAPVGLSYLVAGYARAEGTMAFDPSLPITDAKFHSDTAVFGYLRTLDVWGKSAKFDVVLPYTSFSAGGLVSGQPAERNVDGFNDPLMRFSINFYGAPALAVKDYASYRQDLIVGASLQVSAPLGQYDNTRLLNLGNNRWSFKPQFGVSKAWNAWILEIAPGVTIYTDNRDFNRGGTLAQAPVYSVQGHLTYAFPTGSWISLNGTYFTGGRTTVNGREGDNLQTNTRAGVTFGLPLDRNNAIRLHASSGTWTRTGADFNAIGVSWLYRWGGD